MESSLPWSLSRMQIKPATETPCSLHSMETINNYVMKFHGDTVTPIAKHGLMARDRLEVYVQRKMEQILYKVNVQ